MGPLDAHDLTVHGVRDREDMWLEAGAALVMVTSHDCHFDKEWNQRVRTLTRAGVDEGEAHRIAEADQTLDRLDVVPLKVISADARMQLRYPLAQLDTLRATAVGFELERVVGRHIDRVSFPRERPLFVRLHLDDDTAIDLLQPPVEPDGDAAGRTLPPGSPA